VVDDEPDREFTALFAAHYPDLLRYAIRRVGADAAQDVVADVFLVAWRRRHELPTDSTRLWLFGVAARTVANHVRAEVRQERLRLRLIATADRADRGGDDDADTVHAALERLSPREQEVLRLTEWEQLTPAEAAVVLGCSPAALRVRLHRARRRLAAELQRTGAGAHSETQSSKETTR